LEVVRALLDAKAEVNKADVGGRTPLYKASENGHLEVVRALLDAKAEVNKADVGGRTPLAIALSGNHTQTAALLREAVAKLNAAEEEKNGRTVQLLPTKRGLDGDDGGEARGKKKARREAS
jgi:ankyrin repeat protein